jgi:hypothetical protein
MFGCSGRKGKLAVLYKTLMYILPSNAQLYIIYMHFILGCEKIKIHTFLSSGYQDNLEGISYLSVLMVNKIIRTSLSRIYMFFNAHISDH